MCIRDREKGGLDVLPREEMVRQAIDEELVRRSPVDFGLITVEYPSFRPVKLVKSQIPEGMLCDYLLASSACFPAFKAKDINGKSFIDGGYYDNMPINLALSMGAEEVIAVDLECYGIVRSIPKAAKSFTKVIHQMCIRDRISTTGPLGIIWACTSWTRVSWRRPRTVWTAP